MGQVALRRITDRLRANGYQPLRVGSAVFGEAYRELKQHEQLIDKWQRYAPKDATGPALLIANTAVALNTMLPPDAIEDDPNDGHGAFE